MPRNASVGGRGSGELAPAAGTLEHTLRSF